MTPPETRRAGRYAVASALVAAVAVSVDAQVGWGWLSFIAVVAAWNSGANFTIWNRGMEKWLAEHISDHGPRTMMEIGVEGDLFHPHTETEYCRGAGCVPKGTEL
jgi:hypothetical protein